MTISTNYQVYDLETAVGNYAAKIQQPVLFLRTTGWSNSNDVDKINASKAIYADTIPTDMYTQLVNGEWHVTVLDELSDIQQFVTDTFPESQAQVASNPEMYIFYALYNDQGQVIDSNE
tara:strand:+ start:2888 stop:3244 length:357 start_codon:yes stop_codon:yes gene_type:complete